MGAIIFSRMGAKPVSKIEANKNMMNLEKPGHQVLGSYGAVLTIMQFMDPLEFTKMQQLNKYCYKTAVARAQTRIALPCIIRTDKGGCFQINNDKYLIKSNETKRRSKV